MDKNSFQCDNGQCVNKELVCDGDSACVDNSDEKNCKCFTTQFVCPSGECLHENKLCDSRKDCWDNSDESRCGKQELQDSFSKFVFLLLHDYRIIFCRNKLF